MTSRVLQRPAAAGQESRLLDEALSAVQAAIAPLWPLKDFVAVNPFVGFSLESFLEARRSVRRVRDAELLLPLAEFRRRFAAGGFGRNDIERALDECRSAYPELFDGLDAEDLSRVLRNVDGGPRTDENTDRRFRTVAERIDAANGTAWSETIRDEVSRHCASHYDEGQAAWPSPWKHLPLYEAWQQIATIDRRMERMGVAGFRAFVRSLPADPKQTISRLLVELELPATVWREFLLCELLSVPGWSGSVKCRVRQAEMSGREDGDLIGLLAMRLAYDAALRSAGLMAASTPVCEPIADDDADSGAQDVGLDARRRYALQVAAEIAYRRRLCGELAGGPSAPKSEATRKAAQMVFCIDVRSEVLRRHLESVSERIETFGFAGFFGLPIEYRPLAASHGTPQCPVLLQPAVRIREGLRGAERATEERALEATRLVRTRRRVWKAFQASAASCFSFVESMGLFSLGRLLTDSLGATRPVARCDHAGLAATQRNSLGPVLDCCGDSGLAESQKVDLAHGMLRNLGLTSGFARLVVVCGHGSDTANNPYRASLDCGACGGHSGEPNARVAAALLNDPHVRTGLMQRGIEIPADTWFVAAVHNTTTDDLRFPDVEGVPASHAAELADLRLWAEQASRLTRLERSRRMDSAGEGDIRRRSRDWSEVRPEWGLAGNAAFVVAPRSRTAGRDLGGRTFLHNYSHSKDSDLRVLELIMTAPMVVTNWINLQYYASSVDNRAFGSGNKTIHNVVGNVGVVQGNGGDLMTGLPWQSVHDGQRLQHEPLRLLVVIEAPRRSIQTILEKHSAIQDLVCNGWLTLMSIDEDRFYRYTEHGLWQEHRDAGVSKAAANRG